MNEFKTARILTLNFVIFCNKTRNTSRYAEVFIIVADVLMTFYLC
jgi:hypothetical protein